MICMHKIMDSDEVKGIKLIASGLLLISVSWVFGGALISQSIDYYIRPNHLPKPKVAKLNISQRGVQVAIDYEDNADCHLVALHVTQIALGGESAKIIASHDCGYPWTTQTEIHP